MSWQQNILIHENDGRTGMIMRMLKKSNEIKKEFIDCESRVDKVAFVVEWAAARSFFAACGLVVGSTPREDIYRPHHDMKNT